MKVFALLSAALGQVPSDHRYIGNIAHIPNRHVDSVHANGRELASDLDSKDLMGIAGRTPKNADCVHDAA